MNYSRPEAAKSQPDPMTVEMLNVELSNDPLPQSEPPPANLVAIPPLVEALSQPQVPQAVAVAMPSPAIAFAVPIEGAARVVDVAQAGYSRPTETTSAESVLPPVQKLVFGRGAGKQPAPEYPIRAQDAGQEGTVRVRFFVAENGRVASAEAVGPSPWPLLNDAAVRAIRNRWQFAAGSLRAYEVAIHFNL
jgi:periplasmic protein TonB